MTLDLEMITRPFLEPSTFHWLLFHFCHVSAFHPRLSESSCFVCTCSKTETRLTENCKYLLADVQKWNPSGLCCSRQSSCLLSLSHLLYLQPHFHGLYMNFLSCNKFILFRLQPWTFRFIFVLGGYQLKSIHSGLSDNN